MNSKGQTLVIFIIILPVIILGVSYLVDTGLMYIGRSKLISTCKVIIDKYYDEEISDSKVEEYLKNNEIRYTNYKVSKDNNLSIEVESKIDSIFGNVVGIKEYEISVKVTGYKENDKIKFKVE